MHKICVNAVNNMWKVSVEVALLIHKVITNPQAQTFLSTPYLFNARLMTSFYSAKKTKFLPVNLYFSPFSTGPITKTTLKGI